MTILQQVLKGVDDGAFLQSRLTLSPPLKQLVDDYNKLTINDASLPPVSGTTLGGDFKTALRQLDSNDLLTLLKRYNDAVRGVPPTVSEEQKEELKHRHWLVKFFAFTLTGGIFAFLGMLTAIAWRANAMPDSQVIMAVVNPVVDIIKLLFLSGIK